MRNDDSTIITFIAKLLDKWKSVINARKKIKKIKKG